MEDAPQMNLKNVKRVVVKLLKRVRKVSSGNTAAEKKKTYSLAEFKADQARFEDWRARNPSKPGKEFYSEWKKAQFATGAPQGTFGANLRSGPFEKAGVDLFNDLVGFGLKPSDTCVDYGCGTLRVGQHVIRYLGRGGYWGLDIADWLLEEGRKLIGPELMAEKEPQLRVISRDSVAEVAARKPDMLFSVKVMQHVHPSELAEYFENIMSIIGLSGKAIIGSKWRDDKTVQYRVNGWAHSIRTISDLVASMNGKMDTLDQGDTLLPLEGSGYAKKGFLCIMHKAAPHASGFSS